MVIWSPIVEKYPLTVPDILKPYRRMPSDALQILYHYTTSSGLKGILESGGLRASYRTKMNDVGEFSYAKDLIFRSLDKIKDAQDLAPIAQSLARYTRINLDRFLDESPQSSRAYCACLTSTSDHGGQWETYAEEGRGFAIGFNMLHVANSERSRPTTENPFLWFAPVVYDEAKQREIVRCLINAGIKDVHTFSAIHSQQPEDLTALRDRITQEIVICLFTLIDFIKAPAYKCEREIRLFLDPSDGTLRARDIKHYERGNEMIPFIFIDLRNPITGRIPIDEIKIGPKAPIPEHTAFAERILDDLGYGHDRPRITRSSL